VELLGCVDVLKYRTVSCAIICRGAPEPDNYIRTPTESS